MRLALKLRAGRMIRPMDQHMAVQAGTSARLNTRSGRSRLLETIGRRHVAARQIGAAVDLIAMVTAVTLLAQPRRARLQQRCVARAVRRVADGAIVSDGRVVPEERTPLLRMTGVAGLVDRILDEHGRAGRTVRVVAVGTRHLRRARQAGHRQRMGRDPMGLGALLLVAGEADVSLGRLAQHFLLGRVDVVTIVAGHALALMLTAGPVRTEAKLVTGKTFGVALGDR